MILNGGKEHSLPIEFILMMKSKGYSVLMHNQPAEKYANLALLYIMKKKITKIPSHKGLLLK